MTRRVKFPDMSRRAPERLVDLDSAALSSLPIADPPPDRRHTPAVPPKPGGPDFPIDDARALTLPHPETREEEDALVRRFLAGLEKLFSRDNNWTFLQPLLLTMEHCARCQTCSEACHIFEASGRVEVYRPTYRSEVLRRLYFQHVRHGGLVSAWQHGTVELNWPLVARLAELSYRCNLCRRCAQACPIGADNGLVAREIRKLFSQELGIAPKELHASGSMLQLKVGSSTGMTAAAAKDNVQFIDEEMAEKTGRAVSTPWDVEGADILLIHNAGEILAWPENPGAFGVILDAAGISWTMSSDIAGYDSVNYGLWYDDAQFARVALLHARAAKNLKVKKIVIGECGHAHKSLMVVADRLLAGDLNVPRESFLTVLRDIVMSGRLKLDPSRNDFPVTLHDP
jgi:Fe-S oxidoreductase